MATFGQIVRGIEHAEVALLSGTDIPGAYTDIVGIKGFSVEVTADSDEQKGDDATLAVVQENKALDVTFSSAAANPAVLGVITGSIPVTTGTAGTQVVTYEELAEANTRYCSLRGVAKGRDAANSVTRIDVLKYQNTGGPNFDFSEGAWMEPELSGRGVGRGTPLALYKLISYENRTSMT